MKITERHCIPQRLWGVYSGVILLPYTVASTRRLAISAAEKGMGGVDWEWLKKRGNHVEKVTVVLGHRYEGEEIL